jgi:hypothetical protein
MHLLQFALEACSVRFAHLLEIARPLNRREEHRPSREEEGLQGNSECWAQGWLRIVTNRPVMCGTLR